MAISDRRFAAAWIDSGHQERFDDIGCMVSSMKEHAPSSGTKFFVHEFAGDRWLDATAAGYMLNDDVHSPMAYGVAAFEMPAGDHAGHADHIMSWDELVAGLEARG
jgi:copper chaperone NosL